MYLKKYNLKNKIALVTGAGKGLGRACAIALAEAGANLLLVSRTKKDLDQVSRIIKKLKVKCKSYVCDLTNYNSSGNCSLVEGEDYTGCTAELGFCLDEECYNPMGVVDETYCSETCTSSWIPAIPLVVCNPVLGDDYEQIPILWGSTITSSGGETQGSPTGYPYTDSDGHLTETEFHYYTTTDACNGYLDDLEVKNIVDFEFFLLDQFKKKHKNIVKAVKTKLALDDTLIKELEGALEEIKKDFITGLEK